MELITNVVQGANAERLLLLMHGYGADERSRWAPAVPRPGGPLRHRAARGPIAVPPGFSWFDLTSPDPEVAQQGFVGALDAVDDLLDRVCEEYGMSRSDAVVGGFSQGGGIALALALGRSDRARPAAVLAMSPFIPFAPDAVDWEGGAGWRCCCSTEARTRW